MRRSCPRKLFMGFACLMTIALWTWGCAFWAVWSGPQLGDALAVSSPDGAEVSGAVARKESALGDYAYLHDVQRGCGALCSYETGSLTEGHFFRHRHIDNMDCEAYFSQNVFLLRGHGQKKAPAEIPAEWLDAFTTHGAVAVQTWYFDEQYLDGDVTKERKGDPTNGQITNWSSALVEGMVAAARTSNLRGNYGLDETNALRDALRHAPGITSGGRVLVIGSENPWVEACAIEAGAREVVTLEYGKINSAHPKVSAILPADYSKRYHDGTLEPFDAIISFSSVEHSGLGRYGDALNPWGDMLEIARAWCVTRDGGNLVLGVPSSEVQTAPNFDRTEAITWNAHRIYGPSRYPFLATNWKQLYKTSNLAKYAQPIHVFTK
eukprot:gnl/TRDRNA2_/TRDRNA2_30290_c0_seq1.p1 gnl/TRDRNA2_/TRDRNA2_30290_c0~~gnl/TRDRNA2_/TRDRNA2_30290_c0_seq1.p1  ORF type:complete len:379 (+),score=44.05 gnl/TRDRNA2_/TRDRNA2_30290_c0_seq1:225-1361(+)